MVGAETSREVRETTNQETTMNNAWQVMSAKGNTYGVYHAMSELDALDQYAKENHGCNWSQLVRKMPDLFMSYTTKDCRVII